MGEINWDMNDLVATDFNEEPWDYPKLWKWLATWVSLKNSFWSQRKFNYRYDPECSNPMGTYPPLEIVQSPPFSGEMRHTFFVENDARDGLDVTVRVDIGECDRHLKTIMIHYGTQEFLLRVSGSSELQTRVKSAFPVWSDAETGVIFGLSKEPLQTGQEYWLADIGYFIPGYKFDRSHAWWGQEMISVRIDERYFLLRLRETSQELRANIRKSFKNLLAMKLQVSVEEFELRKTPVPLKGPWEGGARIVESWDISFRPPEWCRSTEITVIYEGIHRVLRIQERLPLEHLLGLLHEAIGFNKDCAITREEGRLLDEEIAFYKWDSSDSIYIWKTPEVWETDLGSPTEVPEIEMLVYFRPETMSFKYTSALSPQWLAMNWAAEEFGVRQSLLRKDIRFRNQHPL
jgi:hypothetical protein